MTREALPEELVFHVARRIASPDARAAYILDACGNDLALRERVVALFERARRRRRVTGIATVGRGSSSQHNGFQADF